MNTRLRQSVRKTLKWSGLGLAVLLLLIVGLLAWVLLTPSGARGVAGFVTSRFAPQVSYASLDGTIAGGLELRDFRFAGPPEAAQIRIARLSVRPTLRMLWSRTLRIENARVHGLLILLPATTTEKPEPETDPSPWVEPPLDIVVDDFELRDGRVMRAGETVFAVKQLDVAARWRRDALIIDRLSLAPGDIAGWLDVSGRVTPAGRELRGQIDAEWRDVVLPEHYAGQVIASAGRMTVEGTPSAYRLQSRFEAGPPGQPTQVSVDLTGTDERARIRQLQLVQRAGQLSLDGDVEFAPVAWQLRAAARQFNPGEWLAAWPGRIDLDLQTQGELSEHGPRGLLNLTRLAGQLRGRPLSGQGRVEFAAPSSLSGNLRVSSGGSRIAVVGRGDAGHEIDAEVSLAIASLGDWLPDSAGSLSGQFRVRGRWPALAIAGSARGTAWSLADYRAARIDLTADVESPRDPSGDLSLRARQVEAAGYRFDAVVVEGSGHSARHQVALSVDGDDFDAQVRVAGGTTPTGWSGELSRLSLQAPDLADVSLRRPASVVLDNGEFVLGETCLDDAQGALCVAGRFERDGAVQARYSLERVSLGLANVLAPEALPGTLRGEIGGEGQVRREVDGRLSGAARLRSPRAELVMRDDEPGESVLGQRTWLLYENFELSTTLQGTSATSRLNAGLQNGGQLAASLEVTELTAGAPRLSGRVNATLPTLAPFGAFVPTLGNVDGTVNAELRIGGTLAAPELTGNVDAQRLQADLGTLGIELRDGRVRGEARADGGFTLAASVASGKGHVELAGTLSERGVIDARVLGQNFEAADIPAAQVVVTPDLTLTGDPEAYRLRGQMTVARADIDIEKMPRDQAPNASPDVVVVRNGRVVSAAERQQAMPLSAEVDVLLGENVRVVGFGLEATIRGELEVREVPGAPTTGSGQLLIDGTYQKYGQDLTVREGRLLFAGSPLDNPRLAIVATRQIDEDLETGLRITGSARRPVVTVISDPDVGEADALSYLVTGRSLNQVGSASGGSQDALASATQSLQGAGAGLVAKRIGQRLGIDEAGVEENEMIGGSALTIGEYLSPRLYLSYGVGLFEPGEVIALRYRLSDDVGVRVQRGSEETRAGVEYRIEK